MTGRKISLGTSHKLKDGKIVKQHKMQPGKTRKVLEARAKRDEAKLRGKSKL